jgi:hypothetical protein
MEFLGVLVRSNVETNIGDVDADGGNVEMNIGDVDVDGGNVEPNIGDVDADKTGIFIVLPAP